MERLASISLPKLEVPVEIDMISPNMIPWWQWAPTVEANGPSGVRFQYVVIGCYVVALVGLTQRRMVSIIVLNAKKEAIWR